MVEPAVASATVVPAAAPPAGASPWRAILIFAALGAISGVLSYLLGTSLDFKFLHFSFIPFGPYESAAPIVPGVVFGVLIAACCWWFGSKSPVLLVLAVLVTTAAWILAYDSTVKADAQFGQQHREWELFRSLQIDQRQGEATPVTPPAASRALDPALGQSLSFAIGGLIGGLGTCLAVALALPRFRRPAAWIVPVLLATIVGAVEPMLDIIRDGGLLALFVLWQAAVMAAIGHALAQPAKLTLP
jgi:hypothetical protein